MSYPCKEIVAGECLQCDEQEQRLSYNTVNKSDANKQKDQGRCGNTQTMRAGCCGWDACRTRVKKLLLASVCSATNKSSDYPTTQSTKATRTNRKIREGVVIHKRCEQAAVG